MTTEATPVPDERERCEECGAPRGATAPVTTAPAPAPAPPAEDAAPPGTHCEWCGAEFPDAP